MNNWLVGKQREDAIDELLKVLNGSDDKMKVAAFNAMVSADIADLKRQEVAIKMAALELKQRELEMKQRESDEKHKLRLLEFISTLGPEEIGKLSSESGICINQAEVE